MKKILYMILFTTLCLSFSGCSPMSVLKDEVSSRKKDRIYCKLNTHDATKFTYGDTEYIILEEKTQRTSIGSWIGYIQKFALLDSQYGVLDLRDIELKASIFQNLPEETEYIVQFFNIYTFSENSDTLVIDVDGGFHKAVPVDQSKDKTAIVFQKVDTDDETSLSVNPDNCTQLIYNGKTYQITDEELEESKLDNFIGFLGVQRVYDQNTGKEIPKNQLDDVEIIPGELSEQQRVRWDYGLVYTVQNDSKCISVEINGTSMRADLIE